MEKQTRDMIRKVNKRVDVNSENIALQDEKIDNLEDGVFAGGARWIDLTAPSTSTKVGANSKPDFDFTNIGDLFPQNDTSEIKYITAVCNHNWQEGSTLFPHVHIRQKANQQAVFKIDFKWYNPGEAEPAQWTTYIMNQYVFTYTSGTIAQIIKGSSGISGTGKKIGSIMQIKLYRDDNVYTGDVLTDQFDIHIQVDSTGSYSEYNKNES